MPFQVPDQALIQLITLSIRLARLQLRKRLGLLLQMLPLLFRGLAARSEPVAVVPCLDVLDVLEVLVRAGQLGLGVEELL